MSHEQRAPVDDETPHPEWTETRRGMRVRVRERLERNVFTLVIFAGCVTIQALVVRGFVYSDSWYTLVSGRVIAQHGLPHHDGLTVLTLGRRWVDQQWLAHLGLYALWSAGGWPLAAFAVVVLYVSAFILSAGAARALGASDRSVAVVLTLCFITGLSNTVFRAQIPAYLLFAGVFVLLVVDDRRPSRRIWLVLPLLVLWANLHGSVVLGAALVSLRGLVALILRARGRLPAHSWRAAGGLLLAPWLCTLASPYALELPQYYRSVLVNPTLANAVTEWAPPTLRSQPLFFVLLVFSLWFMGRSRHAHTPFASLSLFGLGFLGLLAVRNDVWFAIAAAGFLPACLDEAWMPSVAPRRQRFNVIVGSLGVGVGLLALFSVFTHDRAWYERRFPRKALTIVTSVTRADPSVKVFADDSFADWLLFEDPALAGRVAYDIRYELLSKQQLRTLIDYRAEHGIDWQRAGRRYGLLVLDPAADAGAISFYERKPGTKVLSSTHDVVVLQQRVNGAGK
jgi:hypothetical protein